MSNRTSGTRGATEDIYRAYTQWVCAQQKGKGGGGVRGKPELVQAAAVRPLPDLSKDDTQTLLFTVASGYIDAKGAFSMTLLLWGWERELGWRADLWPKVVS